MCECAVHLVQIRKRVFAWVCVAVFSCNIFIVDRKIVCAKRILNVTIYSFAVNDSECEYLLLKNMIKSMKNVDAKKTS